MTSEETLKIWQMLGVSVGGRPSKYGLEKMINNGTPGKRQKDPGSRAFRPSRGGGVKDLWRVSSWRSADLVMREGRSERHGPLPAAPG